MAITMQDARAWLDPEEPNYVGAAKDLGPAALPFLLELVRGGDLGLASKATYLASLIKSDKSVEVLEAAAATNEPILRVQAAAGLQHLKPAHAERLLDTLKSDLDAGVRKVMVKSAARVSSPRVAAVLKQIARSDPEPFVREASASLLATREKKAPPRVRKVAKKATPRKATSKKARTRTARPKKGKR
jgi:HEAT repeat protein